MNSEFAIFEALLWEPPEGYFLLEYHLQRLEHSAVHFSFPMDVVTVRRKLAEYARQFSDRRRKVRLTLARNGDITMEDIEVKPSTPLTAVLADAPIQSGDEFLRHKTTRREVFDRALRACPEAQDVLLWNERGELTETCYGNLVLEIDGRKLTPPLSSGLLPGTFRAHLLERGEIEERILPVESLETAAAVFMINSVRRWCAIRLICV